MTWNLQVMEFGSKINRAGIASNLTVIVFIHKVASS